MRLAVVAYPRLDPETAAGIESFRTRHDPQAHRIAAHFTLVFPVEADAPTLAAEIRCVAASSAPVDFTLACIDASLGIDGRCYVVLEPAEGHARIETMHDRLYSGVLADRLRRDVEYVPHVTVAVGEDAEECGRLAGGLRAVWIPAPGRIVELVLLDLDDDPYRTVEVFGLHE
jgi:2'-5' RNA ligase